MYIIKSKKEQSLNHWKEIKKRVSSHEGELLSGEKGEKYQKKYSGQYLGKDLNTKPIDINMVERYEKTGK